MKNNEDWMEWPNERRLWMRLIVCVLTGGTIALGLIAGLVMLANEILEK